MLFSLVGLLLLNCIRKGNCGKLMEIVVFFDPFVLLLTDFQLTRRWMQFAEWHVNSMSAVLQILWNRYGEDRWVFFLAFRKNTPENRWKSSWIFSVTSFSAFDIFPGDFWEVGERNEGSELKRGGIKTQLPWSDWTETHSSQDSELLRRGDLSTPNFFSWVAVFTSAYYNELLFLNWFELN